ncbi:surface lipoprotein assembly modifier [Moraxella nasovis]|uniref:surface lipoprotein assembly modifier n=1 Tax=Moraxella nasovis TaxID=2904121 RepID=UPI001F603447|nr:surface lipoprotein assembly modifier [Moraxella nasovis]UNU72654.1 surface lipoprotein assembly modifier [Moraxella nasovis]
MTYHNFSPLFALSLLALSMMANAQSTPVSDPVLFEDKKLQVKDDLLHEPTAVATPTLPIPSSDDIEAKITRALIAKDWVVLADLLDEYQKQSTFDQTLYDYALGAMYRSQARHKDAIELYQRVASDERLIYPAFDLAIMLYEDKQYHAAKRQFYKVYDKMPPQMQAVIVQYLNAIRQFERVKYRFGLNYEETDNVNNAANAREIEIQGARFIRDDSSLPQSAHGVRYDVGASKDLNITGNHFIVGDVGVDGVAYWDNPSYDETTLAVRAGYANRNVKRYWQIVPFVEQNWLESDKYSRHQGVSASYSTKFLPDLQVSASLSHTQKRYENKQTAMRHDGRINAAGFTLAKQLGERYVAYAGFDVSQDKVLDLAESSERKGVRLGLAYYGESFGARVMTRYTKRDFLADNFWYDEVRHDREYQVNAAAWYRPFSYKGITPSLNYRYQKIDSNFDSMYSRSSQAVFISFEKLF